MLELRGTRSVISFFFLFAPWVGKLQAIVQRTLALGDTLGNFFGV